MFWKAKFAGILVASAIAIPSVPVTTAAVAAPLAPLPAVSAPAVAVPGDVVEVTHKRKYRKLKRKPKRRYKSYNRRYKRYNRRRDFDTGSFIAGTLLGIIIANPRPHYVYDHRYLPRAHVNYCFKRYRSYRLWDNSWQPYHGPRKLCRSPYVR